MITLKNSEIEKIFNTLFKVDNASKNLDFSVRFKNKSNFKILKEAYVNLTETFNDIFKENWNKVSTDGKEFWEFWDNKEKVALYEELKIQEREIKDKLDELKPDVLALIPEGKKIETEKGEFYIVNRKRYTYSAQTQLSEKVLKEVKKNEERTGLATSEDLPVLTYKNKSTE